MCVVAFESFDCLGEPNLLVVSLVRRFVLYIINNNNNISSLQYHHRSCDPPPPPPLTSTMSMKVLKFASMYGVALALIDRYAMMSDGRTDSKQR
jgi:hypothetical protein